jgi:hypothetical protein
MWSRQQTKFSLTAHVRIVGAGRAQNGLGMISRLAIDNPGLAGFRHEMGVFRSQRIV